jgi:hypothetical protein
MDKRKGYVLLLINAGVRNSVRERKKSEEATNFKARSITLASAMKIELADGNRRE